MTASLWYIVNVSFWILLGISLKPTLVLPVVAVILVLVINLHSTVTRVIGLVKELEAFERENSQLIQRHPDTLVFDSHGKIVNSLPDPVKAASPNGISEKHFEPAATTDVYIKPPTSTPPTEQKSDEKKAEPAKAADPPKPKSYEVKDVRQFNAKDVLQILQQSKILEIAGLTIWDRIVSEVVSFLILLSFLTFFGIGYFVFSTNSQFISSLTTVVVFAIGQGVNIPLQSTEPDKAKFGQSLQAAAQQQEAQKSLSTTVVKKTQ